MSSKVKQLTVESFYRKRLCAVDPIWEEYYLKIAEKLVEKGYESPRLIDNIIESLPREFNPEFYSVMIKVNPKMHDDSHLAEKKMGRAIVAQLIETSFLKEITADEDPQIAQKQKQQTQVKKQILQKKLIAVRGGAQDVTASYKPEGEVVDEKISASGYARAKKYREDQAREKDRKEQEYFAKKAKTHKWDGEKWNKRESVEYQVDEAKVDAGKSPETKEKDRNVRKFGVSHNVAGHGKLRRALHRSNRGDKKIPGDKSQYVETESVQIEGVGEVIKKGVKRHKDAVEKKKVANRKAVPYAALSAETEHEGSVVVEKIKSVVREKVIDEKFATQYKDKSKLSQSSQRKSLGRGASIKDGAKKSGYESKKEHRDTSKKLAPYQTKGSYNAHLKPGVRTVEEVILDYLKERDLPESIVEKLSEEQKTYILDLYIEQSENINGSVGEVQGESV